MAADGLRGGRAAFHDGAPAFLTDAAFYLDLFVITQVLDLAGASSKAVALVFGTYTCAYAGAALLLGRRSDRHGRRASVLLGSLLLGLIPLGLALAIGLEPGPDGALTARSRVPLGLAPTCYGGIALLGVGNALFWPAFQARIGDRERDPAALERAIWVFNLAWTSGKALGFLAAGEWFQRAPWQCLPVGGALGLAVLAIAWLDPAPPAAAAGSAPAAPPLLTGGPAGPLGKRPFLIAGLVGNFAVWGSVATCVGLIPKLGRALDLSPRLQGVLLFTLLAAQGAVFLSMGRLRWVYRRGPLLAALPAAAAGLLLLAFGPGLVPALLGALLVGGAQAITYAASVFYSLDYDGRRGLRTGIHEAVLGLGGALPIAGGALADATGWLRAPLLFMAGVALLAAAVAFAALRLPRSDPARAARMG